jgi:uroporphyrinogen decarboxylase
VSAVNRRERVIQAIRHQQPDFTPYNFHATASVYARVRRLYGLPTDLAVAEFVGNHIAKVGGDFNVNPWASTAPVSTVPSGGPEGLATDGVEGSLHTDEFGCVWDRSSGEPYPVAHPMADDNATLDNYQMPDPRRRGRFDAARVQIVRNNGDVFVFGKLGMVLFERAWSIRGMEALLVDMATRPSFVSELLDRIVYEWDLPIIEQLLDLGVDGLYLGDDWGSKASLLFGVGRWREFIKPRLAKCYELASKRGVVIGQHSDGNVVDLLPDLIELGLDVFNPVDPAIYDPEQLKRTFGRQLTMYGGIDSKKLPFIEPSELVRHIQERAMILGRDGGYILQSSHTILDDVPDHNLIAYIEACHKIAGLDTSHQLASVSSAVNQ